MIYYVTPNIVSTSGKFSPNIRIYQMLDSSKSAGFVHIYKNGTWTRKSYNRHINVYWKAVKIHSSLPIITPTSWFSPQLFSSLELATAYAIQAYQHTYAVAEKRAATVLANLQQSAKLSAEAEVFIAAYPELFI